MGNLSLDVIGLMHYNPLDVQFTENGKIGWRTKEGGILIPAEYDQIEKCAESLYLRDGDNYEIYYIEYGVESYRHDYNEGSFFVENGKFGWRKGDKNVISAKYDYISSWGDIFCVKLDGRCFYLNDKEEEVLIQIRHFDGETDEDFPFASRSNDKSILTTYEYVGHAVKEDPNVVKIGTWVKINRMSHEEIMSLLVNPEDELPMSETELENYNSSFSYEYSAYFASSTSKKGIEDCLNKIGWIGAYYSTWYYIVKVWKAVDEEPTADELRQLRYFIENKDNIGEILFAFGHDSELKAGETKMLLITHYNEECFPSSIGLEWDEYLRERTLSEIEERLVVLRKTVEEEVSPEDQREVWQNQFIRQIVNMRYYEGRNWAETVKVLNFLKPYSDDYTDGIYYTVEKLFSYFEPNEKEEDEFLINKLQWLIDNGADVNYHRCNGTALDLILNYTSGNDDIIFNQESVAYCQNLLIRHGAMSMKELMAEEAKNNDYSVELQRMKRYSRRTVPIGTPAPA